MNWLPCNVPGLNKKHTKRLCARKNQKGGFFGPVMKATIIDAPKFVTRGMGVKV